MEKLKDEEIIALILKGKAQLYSELVLRYQNKLFSTIYHYTHDYEDTKDLAQEIFIKVYNNLHKYNSKASFSTWIYRIAVNSCIDWTRKRRLVTVSAFETDENEEIHILENISDDTPSPEDVLLKEEYKTTVKNIVMELPDIYKTVVILYYYEDFSPKEISDILNIPKKTIDSRLYRARDILKSRIINMEYGGGAFELQ